MKEWPGVGKGWWDILNGLSHDLYKMGWNGTLDCYKEKFGTLRFYIGYGNDEMFERIIKAEEESAITCEYCGEPGVLRPGGWLKTLCDECHKKWKGVNDEGK